MTVDWKPHEGRRKRGGQNEYGKILSTKT